MEPGKSLAVFGLGALGLSVIQAAKKADLENVLKETGTIVTVEGPRFSSRAESFMFKSWNAGTYILTWQGPI